MRTLQHEGADLVFVAAADFPNSGPGKHQYVQILDGAALNNAGRRRTAASGAAAAGAAAAASNGSSGGVDPCAAVETLTVEAAHCVTPHELGVDPVTAAVYLACVTGVPIWRSNTRTSGQQRQPPLLTRLRPVSGQPTQASVARAACCATAARGATLPVTPPPPRPPSRRRPARRWSAASPPPPPRKRWACRAR